MRLFLGIDLPEQVTSGLKRLLDKLRPLAPLRWSRVENLHITTKFIGEWPEERLDELKAALHGIAPRAGFRIGLGGLGWFPNPHQPRIFWVGVKHAGELSQLALDTDEATASLGIEKEQREFRPHLTLARIEPRGGGPRPDLAALRRAIASLDENGFGGEFDCDRFHLYLSEMGPGGSRYTKLASFPLEAP